MSSYVDPVHASPLSGEHEQLFREHLRRMEGRETCSVCDAGRHTVTLLDIGFVARTCAQCGHVLLFDPAILGLVPGWRSGRGGAMPLHRCLLSTPPEPPSDIVSELRKLMLY
jgi:hypothetical protein